MSFSINSGVSTNNINFGSIIPNANDTYKIGSSVNSRFLEIWGKNLYTSAGLVSTSDINKKKEIQPITDALSVVMRLKPKSYKYIDGNSNRTHTGFIAQECMDLFCPNWGVYVQNGSNIGLRYEEFISLNTGAIQQINNRLVDVEKMMRTMGQIQVGTGASINLFEIEDIKSRVESFESRLNSIDYVNRICNSNNIDINDIKSRLESIETKVKTSLTREHVSVMNDTMYEKIMSSVDNKLENERKIKEEKAREIESVINNFANEFRQQILGLIDKVNMLVSKFTQLDCQSQNSFGELPSLVEKVNLLVARCNDLENIRERYSENLKSCGSDQTELISSFESSFRQQMSDLINRVESLSNELELSKSVNQSLRNEFSLVNNILERVNLLSSDIDTIRETHKQSVRDQLIVNNNIETSFRQQLLELVEKVNLLSIDLDMIKNVVTQSSKEQKSEELELINRLMEKINQLSVELNTIRETQNVEKSEEMELINSLMLKVNSLSSDLDTFRDSVRQTVQEQTENGVNNFENKFRSQMLDLIEKVNTMVLRCNELDTKLNNIPKPENKLELDDSDSCGSSMMETLQERLYKAEQLLSKQDKMIKKLTAAVNNLIKNSDSK